MPDLPPAEQSPVHPRTVLREPAPPVLRIERDVGNDLVRFVHVEDEGKVRIDRDGWEFGAKTTRRTSIRPGDPTSARIELEGLLECGREGGPQVRIETSTVMTCDERDFHVEASLDAYENDEPVFSRSWSESIPRDGG